MAHLELKNLSVHFGGLRAVNNLDLSVAQGELRCLLGPNGAGKSTTLDLICGKTAATSGQILFEGRDITSLSEHRRARLGIGRKFQTPSVFKELTVLENMEIARSQNPGILTSGFVFRTHIRGRLKEILELVELMDHVHTKAGNLSHGQTQWLEIAMLLIQEAKLILMDEPTAGMTIQETRRTGEIFNSLKGHHTMIVVEHDMTFVRQIAETVTVMELGALLAQGSIKEIESDPKVRAAYLGNEVADHA
ncbi:urea ABC transporter ATP-binding protein UrtD [Halomonas daqingensis]|uniref:urea ABC transporter ATP-binding protein UrtD n=1 Tax=Billgrantia desiderata TaxID=52021 RepID=UPI000A38D102|nr:urea ABC transporter ATP-binding protein UrtD [Halomonas desiderata]MCE8013444.1 urea ABC transporter ATP-binding protein UrtD [Halomonas desiderata]MCE8028901.1 urea ABC transporter ATP-binding protein UrtD [Halomonas desiderata]OUE46765.1 urea ABC transporter ATP-binding protein UrtD [Halomonas desiderata SP1]